MSEVGYMAHEQKMLYTPALSFSVCVSVSGYGLG